MSDVVPARKGVTGIYGKRGWETDPTTEKFSITIRKVLAADSHVAPHGGKWEFFDAVLGALNSNTDFSSNVNFKNVRDLYECIPKAISGKDKANTALSSVAGVICDANKLLSLM